jgi:hypothetical protein
MSGHDVIGVFAAAHRLYSRLSWPRSPADKAWGIQRDLWRAWHQAATYRRIVLSDRRESESAVRWRWPSAAAVKRGV